MITERTNKILFFILRVLRTFAKHPVGTAVKLKLNHRDTENYPKKELRHVLRASVVKDFRRKI